MSKHSNQEVQSILENIQKLTGEVQKVGYSVAKKVADEVKEDLERNTPVDPDSKNPTHLKDNVVVKKLKTNDSDYHIAYVAYKKGRAGAADDVHWRAMFVEWGTKYQRPQGMVEKTRKKADTYVEKRLIEELRQVVKRNS